MSYTDRRLEMVHNELSEFSRSLPKKEFDEAERAFRHMYDMGCLDTYRELDKIEAQRFKRYVDEEARKADKIVKFGGR
jgi:hypothetical protein